MDAWQDLHLRQQAHHIYFVRPEPPRHQRFQEAIADLIISRDVDMQRFVGLVTVAPLVPNAADQNFLFSIATSFPADVSGIMIRDVAEAEEVCTQRRCNIFHGWDEIPQTHDPVHRMSDGDSLVIFLTSLDEAGDADYERDSAPM
eukprot:s332_g43.t1